MRTFFGNAFAQGQEPSEITLPEWVDAWRAKIVLSRHGLLEAAEQAIADFGTQESGIYYNQVPRWNRDHYLVSGLAFTLNLDQETFAQYWIEAQTAE